MPISMKYCWNKNLINDTSAALSVYEYNGVEPMQTPCSVYTWGNVDAYGSMALVWLPEEIVNTTIEETISTIVHPELPPSQGIEYKKILYLKEHKLSGWHSCNNKWLIPG